MSHPRPRGTHSTFHTFGFTNLRITFNAKLRISAYFLLAIFLLAMAGPAIAGVAPGTTLMVGKTADRTNGFAGTYVQFHITITNAGPLGASNVFVQETLPGGLQLANVSPGPGSSYNTNNNLWNISTLPVGAAASLNLSAQFIASGYMTNTASYAGSSGAVATNPITQTTARVTLYSVPITGLAVAVKQRNAEGQILGPLAGATVQTSGAGSGTTDAQGLVLLTNISPATYTVTVTKSGFYPNTHTVTIAKGQMPFENFEMLQQAGPGPPSEFDFSSPQGNYFIPAMPGNITFSAIVAWNGTPGSATFNVAGTGMPASLTDLGGGTARATLTIPAVNAIAAASELTLSVVNGENLSRAFNLGAYFEPLPGMVPSWFTWLGNTITWAASSTVSALPNIEYKYKKNWTIYSNSIPGGSLKLSSSLGMKLDLGFVPKSGTFSGAIAGTGTGELEVKLPGVSGIEVFVEGGVGVKGTLKVAFAGLNPPVITPGWSVSLNVKDGLRAPAIAVVPVVLPFATPAVTFLQNTWGLRSIVNSLKLGMTFTEGGSLSGVYRNGEAGNCFLRTTALNSAITAGLELEAAVKLGGAKAKIYGGGNGTLDFSLCPQFTFNSLTFEAYAGFSASWAIFSYDKKFSAELRFGGNGGPLYLIDSTGFPAGPDSAWEPIGADLRRWGMPNQLADQSISHGRTASPGSTESLVVSNVLDLANPSVFADPSETFILLTLFDSQKPWYASTDIGALRQTNGGTWTLTRVADDQTADLNPKVRGVGSNLFLAAWERITGDISGATNPVQAVPHLEIVAAWFDRQTGLWSAPQQLTTNAVVDRDPLPVSFGATQGILWIQNTGGAGTGDATNGDSLLFSQWTGSSWSPPQILWSASKGIISFSFVADGSGQGHVVFSVDQDGNLDTTTDRELYSAATVSGVWQTANQLTSDLLEDSLPTLVAPNGIPLCVWNQGDALAYATLSAWNPKPVFAQTTSANHTPTLDGVTLPGGAAVAYAVPTPDGLDMFAAFYNAAQDSWSLPRRLTQDQDVESSLAVAFNGTNLVVAYDKTQNLRTNLDLDVNGQTMTLTNVLQPGRSDLYVLTHTPGSDPGLVPASLMVDPPNPTPGTNAMLSVVIQNFGDTAIQNVPIAFYDGDPQQGGIPIGSTQIIPGPMIGGATQQVSVSWAVPVGAASHSIHVVVDPTQSLADRDRSNNSLSLTAVLPDLTVEGSWNNEVGTTSFSLVAQVANQGVIPSDACALSWRLEDHNGEEIGRSAVGPLAPGQSAPVIFLWNTSGRQFASPYVAVYAVVDSTNSVLEFDETNNDGLQMVPVAGAWVPRITSIAVPGPGVVQLAFTAANSSPSEFIIESTASLSSPVSWQTEPGAIITMSAPGVFQVQLSPQGNARFYRVRVPR
jgi:uncharacterized repeat protein (TIGR01451 family)